MSIRTYQLYLSTAVTLPTTNLIVPVNVTDKGNATWQVDFKSLFGLDYNRFRRCTVRCQLHSSSFNANVTDENNFDGYLSLNLPSTYSASTSKGTPIACINPSNVTYTVSGTTSTKSFFNFSTLGNVQGCDINMPSQNQFVNIQFLPNDAFTIMQNVPDYQILLQFELSDEILSLN